nr:heterogeneous nuclear ribonucleoprotein A1 [Phallusia mammillata]
MSEYFGKYGTITDCVVIKDPNKGHSKGFGFVTFATEEEADKCMQDRPHTVDGKQVDAKRAVSREESSKPGAHVQVKRVFIGGIKEHCTEDMLKEYFQAHGTIESVELPLSRETQKPRGFAFITFSDFDTVDKLVAKRHHHVEGMRCEVKKALSKVEMEKAKQQIEERQQHRHSGGGGGGGGRRGGGGRGRGSSGGRGGGRGGYNQGGGGGGGYYDDSGYGNYHGYGNNSGYDDYGQDNSGYGGYDQGYDQGGYNEYDDGYGGGYGSNASNYGPMKGQYGQRAAGPYGGEFYK